MLGYCNYKDYVKAVLQQIEMKSNAGVAILERLRLIMPNLTRVSVTAISGK
jgi:hypothetical protein